VKRVPWRKSWGPLRDGRSKLARLAKRHAIEELRELGVVEPTTLQRRRAARLGQFLAFADMVATGIGVDPGATVRRLTVLEKSAETERRILRTLVDRTRNTPMSLRDYVEAKDAAARSGPFLASEARSHVSPFLEASDAPEPPPRSSEASKDGPPGAA